MPPKLDSEALVLIDELDALGVEINERNGALHVRAPSGVLGARHRERLRALKPQLVALLAEAPRRERLSAPLTGAQRQQWFVMSLDSSAAKLEIVVRLLLRGALDVSALEASVVDLVERHTILRARFVERGGIPLQVLDPTPKRESLTAWVLSGSCDPREGRPFVARVVDAHEGAKELRLTIHHLVCDGWSISTLLVELGELYSARTEERHPRLATLRTHPFDRSRELVSREQEPRFAARVRARAQELAGVQPIALPADWRSHAGSTGAGGRARRVVDSATWSGALAWGRELDATGFMLVAGALALVLGRWTDAEEVCLGVPFANRRGAELEHLVGMFVDTLLLRISLTDDSADAAGLISELRMATLAMIENADLPLDRVIASLPENSSRGRLSVPDVMLNFVGFGRPEPRFAGLDCDVEIDMPGSRFDLTVYAYPQRGGELELVAAFRSDHFEEETIAALLEQVALVLARAPRSIGSWRELSLRSEEVASPPTGTSLDVAPDWLLQRIDAAPDERVAVRGHDGPLRYDVLRRRASDLSIALCRAAAARPLRVAIFARREPGLVVALVAALRAGVSFVVIDAAQPSARQIDELSLARPGAWICVGQDPPPTVADFLAGVPRIDRAATTTRGRSFAPAEDLTAGESYLAFTSGTSGRPRGVVGTLPPLVHFFAWYVTSLEITADDRFALLSGLGHDPCLRDILGALVAGARVCVPPGEPAEIGPALADWMAAEGVTVVHMTPSLARVLAATARPLPALRRICFGGEQLRSEDVECWRRLAPQARIYNFYGATETPQAISVRRVEADDRRRAQVPIGAGIDGVRLEVVNASGAAAVGELGEIQVCTPYLAAGYLGEPELTRAQFDRGARYRTGDRGRLRYDGSVVVVGRLDDQVVIRGARVEPAEVEAAIIACAEDPAVRVAVVARTSEPDGARELIAWVVGVAASSLGELRRRVAQRLPRAMVPTRWAAIDQLPISANAKIDRRALERLPVDADEEPAGELPKSALERALAEIWGELLNVRQVARDDDFFAIGGHSLLAVTLVARIYERLGVELPVRVVFERPTLAECARVLEERRSCGELRRRTADDYPASFAQTRLWVAHHLDADGVPPLCITQTVRRRQASWSIGSLERALVALERRHEVLRTVFSLASGSEGLLARVLEPRTRILERREPPERLSFDLERGPVWRAWLWTTADGEERLSLCLHHIAGEAGSIQILTRELAELYRAACEGRSPELPPSTFDYGDVAVWEREQAAHAEERAVAAWCIRLAGLQPLELPTARGRPTRQGYRGGWRQLDLCGQLVSDLHARANSGATSLYTVALTALVAVLARWCGTTDVAVGSPVGLRPHPATADIVGPFLNLVCVRVDAGGNPTADELLGRAAARAREAFMHSNVPFEQVLRALDNDPAASPRELGRTPLFSVLLNVVEVDATERNWARLDAERISSGSPRARYDLSVYISRHSEGWRLSVLYDAALFDDGQGELLLDHIESALRWVAGSPSLRLRDLPLRPCAPRMTPASRRGPRTTAFARLQGVARRDGGALAIDDGREKTTYAELVARALAVAGALAGSPAWERVGLLVREDWRMAAGMFGALAAGVAYVPLDPRLPIARLRTIIDDAQLDGVLCGEALAGLAETLADGRRVVVIDRLRAPTKSVEPAAQDGLAYLLYTSGSTGRPKAVMQSRANLYHHATTYIERLGIGPTDRVSLIATHAFDAAVMDIYGALLSGATLCPLDIRGDALTSLPAALVELSPTVFHATPTVLRHLVAMLEDGAGRRIDGVRWVVLGGEEARRRDARDVARWFGRDTRLINGLGPTECTLALQEEVDLRALAREGEAVGERSSLPVGAPTDGVSIRLETPVGEQVALYGVGEIILESDHLALGYWRRPAETAAAFSDRSYRSGDLGRWLPGGRIAFAGRQGGYVKIRGFRVETGEIEGVLREVEGVRAAAVLVHQGKLIGFYTGDASPDAIMRAVNRSIPRATAPSAMRRVDSLPATATGKIDRRALARLTPDLVSASVSPPRRPDGAAEAAIWAIWTRILGRDPSGAEHDLFTCGGDSLDAARLVAALRGELNLEVRLDDIFEGATIASLAARLEGSVGVTPRQSASARLVLLTRGADATASPVVVVLPPGQRARSLELLASLSARPLWALEPPEPGGSESPAVLAALVDGARAALESSELHGRSPILAGYSNGGLLAWCLAGRPWAKGNEPGGLVLIDTIPPQLLAARPWSTRGPYELFAAFARDLTRAQFHSDRTLSEAERWRALAEFTRAQGEMTSVPRAELESMYARFLERGARSHRMFSTLVLEAGVLAPLLIEARAGEDSALEAGWRAIDSRVRTIRIAGDHFGILRSPHVERLAEVLDDVTPPISPRRR
ncbi:MAG: AMP-binding protein [Nannocystaceae bacterium]